MFKHVGKQQQSVGEKVDGLKINILKFKE